MPLASSPPPLQPPDHPPARVVVPPLLPILLPLVVAAIVLAVAFARFFPVAEFDPHDLPPPRFTDVTAESGITFVPYIGTEPSPTTLGGGVVVFDYDNDGDSDLFFVNGAPWPWEEEIDGAAPPTCALFRNDGHGRFTDVTAPAGVGLTLQGMAAAAGDFDRDGWPDLYVTAVGENRLLRNQGNGRFVDVTAAAGVGGDAYTWSTGAVWLDADGDGWLDLVVAEYARWPREIELELAFKIAGVGRSYGAPAGFVSAAPSLYRNLGDGTFEERASVAGLRNLDPQTGLPRAATLAVAAVEANGDGRLDLLFTHQNADETLFVNLGHGAFREWLPVEDRRREGAAAGLAATSALSLAPAIGSDDFAAIRTLLTTRRREAQEGLVDLNRKLGAALIDYALRGERALLLCNWLMEPEINRFDLGREFAHAPGLLVAQGTRWIQLPLAPVSVANDDVSLTVRGVAVADLDGDGDQDVVFSQPGAAPRVWRNDLRAEQPWLRVQLQPTSSAPGAPGARVEVQTPRRLHVQTVAPAISFFAQSESTLTFGLGDDARVRAVVVVWPGGQRQELRAVSPNQTLIIREGPGR
ncbi:MAG TPA: CRTAC1 family protein [Candidatus Synoicihabitans sp.]|nr:CRTAC1 family protein [Candidatus Synoicihabitans sp.]